MELQGTRIYDSGDKFLYSRRRSGAHAIRVGDQWLDILFEDRGSEITLVAFHGAASDRIQTLPYFTGKGTAESLDWNLIALSDPSLALGEVDLAWFLGNRAMGPLHQKLSPLIRHLLGETHPVLFGGSGGAYAAIWFGQDFPDSSVVVFNPRLNLSAPPEAVMGTYLEICHRTVRPVSPRTIRRNFVTEDLGEYYAKGLPFDLHIIQNSGDKPYLRNQVQPFVTRHSADPRLQVQIEYFGGGHSAPIPQKFLQDYLLSVNTTESSLR